MSGEGMNPPMTDARSGAGAVMSSFNVIALLAVVGVLAGAFAFQIARHELPCPLCLLQRIALCMMAAGLIYNLRFGPRARGYGMILLAASAGGVVAVRQILLHIAPGDPGYGSPVLGLHYYTWATIVFAVAVVATAVVLLFDRQLIPDDAPRPLGGLARIAIGLAIAVTVLDVASTLAECGLATCPDNPVRYELLPAL